MAHRIVRQLTVPAILLSLLFAAPVHAERPQPNGNMWELGLFLGALFPPADHQLLDTDTKAFQSLSKVAFDIGLRVSYLPLSWAGLELEGALMPTSTRVAGDSAILYSIRGHVLLQYPWWISPFVLGGIGGWGVSSDALGKDIDLNPHWGAGAKLYATHWLAVRVDFRHTIGSNTAHDGYANYFEVLAGVSWVLGMNKEEPVKDSDGDGIADDKDKCPDQAGPPPDGCPVKDSDGDQIPDDKDKCPSEPGLPPDGCPADKDGDKVLDKDDRCPNQPGPAELKGCPDKDGDGVPDIDDQCPDQKGPASLKGCPDRDGDQVPDKDDRCPDVPGLKDHQGCMPAAAAKFQGAIKGITFAFGSAKIKKASNTTLDEAVKLLKEYPTLKLAIEGHTDNVGKPEKNQTLSQARADAVRDYLVSQGIESARLESKGFGDTQPVESNKSAKGRAVNRRIEFKVSAQ